MQRKARGEYVVPGPNFVWSVDGYEKLSQYGFQIYACIDAFSRYIIWIYVGKWHVFSTCLRLSPPVFSACLRLSSPPVYINIILRNCKPMRRVGYASVPRGSAHVRDDSCNYPIRSRC